VQEKVMEDVSVKAEARLALAATWYSNATVRSRSCSCHGDGDAVLPRSHAYLWHHLRAVTTVFKHVNARGNVSGMHICKRGHANRIPKEIATLVELGTIEATKTTVAENRGTDSANQHNFSPLTGMKGRAN
jgi:hypothetical protein